MDGIRAARANVADPVKEYVLDLVAATREHPDVAYGGSPRATLSFLYGAKARAAIRGRSYVIPDDVEALAEPILAHRLVLHTDAELSDVATADVVDDVVAGVDVPDTDAIEPAAAVDGAGTDR